ncbi:MAG: arylamine N-acetyltransferase [Ekhidna sp.]
MKSHKPYSNQLKKTSINEVAYLSRIGLQKEEPNISFLKKLHKSHLLNIPFENLDIHYGQKIILDYEKVFKKVVENKRGGFCYELNGLFHQLLLALGFNCHLISGKVKNKETGEFGREFDHMIILVIDKDDLWIVDVGFGEGFTEPKKVDTGSVQMDYTTYWRMTQDPDENYLLQKSNDASHFTTVYQFDLKPRQMIEFMGMCDYHQTSPDSYFTGGKLITQLTETGRTTLTDRMLKVNSLSKTTEIPILNEDEFISKLSDHFMISSNQLIPNQ